VQEEGKREEIVVLVLKLGFSHLFSVLFDVMCVFVLSCGVGDAINDEENV
jgi:hypothetical protein